MATTFETGEIQQLPYSLEAEQSILGAILVDPECFPKVLELIKAESFYRSQHRRMFELMSSMFTRNKAMDFITILGEVRDAQIFQSPEEAKIYLAQLAEVVPTSANIEAYCRIVQEKYDARRLKIYDIRQGHSSSGLKHIRTAVAETYETLQRLSGAEREKYRGTSTGFPYLDKVLTGLNNTDLILIAARPGMGKTSFALNIAEHVALKAGKRVAIFSLEMSSEQIALRLLSAQASIEGQRLRAGELTGDEWYRLSMVSQAVSQSEIYLDDTPGISIGEMKAKLRRLRHVDLVIIDYLQLMSSGKRRQENRVQEVSELTRNLKIMAKELNVPLITLSQLSRGPESRTDHKPMLSDLRESGSIEQDADIVMLLHREDYYNREEAEERNVALCDVAKNRHGEVATVKLGWDSRYTRFTNLEFARNEP